MKHIGRRRKYGRPRIDPGMDQWVFGMIDVEIKDCHLQLVCRRNAETPIPIIRHHVLRGSRINSDKWAGFRNLRNYDHRTVNHSEE